MLKIFYMTWLVQLDSFSPLLLAKTNLCHSVHFADKNLHLISTKMTKVQNTHDMCVLQFTRSHHHLLCNTKTFTLSENTMWHKNNETFILSSAFSTWLRMSHFTVVCRVGEWTKETWWKAGQHRVSMRILREADGSRFLQTHHGEKRSINGYLLVYSCQRRLKKRLTFNISVINIQQQAAGERKTQTVLKTLPKIVTW